MQQKYKTLISALLLSTLIGCGGTTDSNDAQKKENKNDTKKEQQVIPKALSLYELTDGVIDTINLETNNTEDWFSVDLTPDTYTVIAELLRGTEYDQLAAVGLYIYDQADAQVFKTAIGNRADEFSNGTFEVETAGTYKLLIKRRGGWSTKNTPAKYKVQILPSVEKGYTQDAEGEINDKKPIATPITFDQLQQGIDGKLLVDRISDEEDWYSVYLTPDTYTLSAQLLTGTERNPNIATMIRIYDPIGLKIYYKDIGRKADTSIKETVEITEAGIYKIQIQKILKTVYHFDIKPGE